MSEVLVKFDEPIADAAGREYYAQAMGKDVGGEWQGWLEFIPADGKTPARASDRETTQPNHTDLEYWAQGLTRVFLEGALVRALSRSARTSAEIHSNPRRKDHS